MYGVEIIEIANIANISKEAGRQNTRGQCAVNVRAIYANIRAICGNVKVIYKVSWGSSMTIIILYKKREKKA